MKPTRRQLLKGSLAAPLVLTARPASAWALSSATACKIRDADRGSQYPKPLKMRHYSDDEWLRVDCDLHEIKVYKKGSWHKVDGKFFLGTDKNSFWRLKDGYGGELNAEKTSYTKSNCWAKKTGERKYGLCYVDDNAHLVGYAWETHGGKCITRSCWSTFSGRHT